MYFSGKNLTYGYKNELFVLPNGFAIEHTHFVFGSTADLAICRSSFDLHKNNVKKVREDLKYVDNGETFGEYSASWAVLMDKGYNRLADTLRCITLKKMGINKWLISNERASNEKISYDRVIVENHFGRLCLYNPTGSKWRWDKYKHFDFTRLAVALTNAHVFWNPLQNIDTVLSIRT